MNKKGFTLIELLAVIVILAIIALIATPIVLNIINDARESSGLRSAEFYLDGVEQSILRSELNNKRIGNDTYDILEDGNICLEYDENKVCEDILEVEIDGQKPTSGKVVINNGQLSNILLRIEEKEVANNSKGELIYVEAQKSFKEDNWETIAANVKVGNISKYTVGDKKEIKLEGFTNEEENSNGLYTVRIANTSTPSECSTTGFSQTTCGFVIEFVDIITEHAMNPTDTNAGGWEASEMRKYVNNTIYNSLPEELRNNIIDTYVVSGQESGKTENYKTNDKLYLLSTKEVYGYVYGDGEWYWDALQEETRQLDYYNEKGVTFENYDEVYKFTEYADWWWLRSAAMDNTCCFLNANVDEDWGGDYASYDYGVAPAFRIG